MWLIVCISGDGFCDDNTDLGDKINDETRCQASEVDVSEVQQNEPCCHVEANLRT